MDAADKVSSKIMEEKIFKDIYVEKSTSSQGLNFSVTFKSVPGKQDLMEVGYILINVNI